jgi:hypothetical protein
VKRIIFVVVAVCALALAGTAAAALVPGIFGDPSCVSATYGNGVLHLEKNCATEVVAAAGADITGLEGQTFQSASFTLADPAQCQGGSPRFNVVTSDGLFFLGCNNVTPTINGDGTATYTFTPTSLNPGIQFPTGTIQSISILIDVQGEADITNIVVNGVPQLAGKDACKNGGWKNFTDHTFKNQGECVSFFAGS